MATLKKRVNFFESEEGVRVEDELRKMVQDGSYFTNASYSANSATYPNNLIPFIDKHKNYLTAHPSIDPDLYLSNLRLVTRLR